MCRVYDKTGCNQYTVDYIQHVVLSEFDSLLAPRTINVTGFLTELSTQALPRSLLQVGASV